MDWHCVWHDALLPRLAVIAVKKGKGDSSIFVVVVAVVVGIIIIRFHDPL